MNDYRALAKDLLCLPGLSGYEKPVRERIKAAWEPYVDEIWVSPLGSLHGLKKGRGLEPRRKLFIATHMDAVGMIATRIEPGGYIRFTSIGGLDPRVLPYQEVWVHGKESVKGLIGIPGDRHLPELLHGKSVPLEHCFIDTGFDENQVREFIHVGDLISFANDPVDVDEETLMGHTLDDRAAVVAASVALDLLHSRLHQWDIVVAATVQEELGLKGARTSGFAEMPDLAIAIDVGFAKEPGASGYFLLEPGSGPAIGWGPVCNPVLSELLMETAERFTITHTREINPGGHTGTDGDAISLVGAGIPTAVISIPLRFMHSPVEMVRYEDMFSTGRLIAEFAAALDENTLSDFVHSIDEVM